MRPAQVAFWLILALGFVALLAIQHLPGAGYRAHCAGRMSDCG